MTLNYRRTLPVFFCALIGLANLPAYGNDWSDTNIGARYGSQYREPFNRSDIAKQIVSLTHVSGYKYGANFFNVDLSLRVTWTAQAAAGAERTKFMSSIVRRSA